MSLAAQSDSSYFRRFVGAIREGYDGFSKAIKRRKPQRGGSIGEATLGAATSSGGAYAWPAAYGAEKLEQVRHFRLWRYIAIRAIAETMARHLPQVGLRRKPGQVEKGNPRVLNSLLRQKALVSMAAHEEIEACDSDHPLSMLLRNPNRPDTGYTFWYRKPVFLELTGESYAWKVRNRLGEVVELWELFPQWVTPRPGSQRLIDKYEIRPYGYGGSGGAQMFEVDPDDMIALRYPSPLTMLNGWSPTQACAEWGDVGEAIDASRWYMFENGSRPDMVIETDASVLGKEPFKAHQLAAFYAQFEARMRGRENNGKPIVMNPGMKAAPWAKTAVEMDYHNSADQNRTWQMAVHRVTSTVCGLSEDETFASSRTHLSNFLQQTMGPKYTFIGEVFTEQLASEWGDDYMIYWPDMTPTDPEQLNADITVDSAVGARTPNEVRKSRGLEPYPHGGDNPIIGGIEMPWVDKGAETAYQWDQSDEQVKPGEKPKDEKKPAKKDDEPAGDKGKSFHRNGHGLPLHLLPKKRPYTTKAKRLA